MITSLTRQAYLRDPDIDYLLRKTIAASSDRLNPSNIKILNVTNVLDTSQSNHHGDSSYDPRSEMNAQKRNLQDTSGVSGVQVDYLVAFIAQVVLGNSSEPEKAFSLISNQLNDFVISDAFSKTLQYFAMVFNVPSLQNCTSVPALVVNNPTYGASVFHSAKPSIAPSSSPSITPTIQPAASPKAGPSIQPSSSPTYHYATLWRKKVDELYDRYISPVHGTIFPYVDLISSDTEEMYGSCSSWLAFTRTALSTLSSSKRLISIALVHYYGPYLGNSTAQAFYCDEVDMVTSLVTHLMSKENSDVRFLRCGGRNWTTFFCPSIDNRDTYSPAVCVDCRPSCHDPLLTSLLPCSNGTAPLALSAHNGLVTMLAVGAEDNASYGISYSAIVFGSIWAVIALYTAFATYSSRKSPKIKIHPVSLRSKTQGIQAVDHSSASNSGLREASGQHLWDKIFRTSFFEISEAFAENVFRPLNLSQFVGLKLFYSIFDVHGYIQWLRVSFPLHVRMLRSMELINRLSIVLVLTAYAIYVQYPLDDHSCAELTTAAACSRLSSVLNSDEKNCVWWADQSNSDVYGTSCLWVYHGWNFETATRAVLIVLLCSTLLQTLFFSFLYNFIVSGLGKEISRNRPPPQEVMVVPNELPLSYHDDVFSPSVAKVDAERGANYVNTSATDTQTKFIAGNFLSQLRTNYMVMTVDEDRKRWKAQWTLINATLPTFLGERQGVASKAQKSFVQRHLNPVLRETEKLELQMDCGEKRLWSVLISDLMGESSLDGQLFKELSNRSGEKEYPNSMIGWSVRVFVGLLLLAIIGGSVYFSLHFMAAQPWDRQWFWLVVSFAVVVLDAFCGEMYRILWIKIWAPRLLLPGLMSVLESIQRTVKSNTQQLDKATSIFSGLEQLMFPSHKMAATHEQSFVGQLILSHPNIYADCLLLKAQQVNRVFGRYYSVSVWPRESYKFKGTWSIKVLTHNLVGRLKFNALRWLMWFGVCPPGLQRLVYVVLVCVEFYLSVFFVSAVVGDTLTCLFLSLSVAAGLQNLISVTVSFPLRGLFVQGRKLPAVQPYPTTPVTECPPDEIEFPKKANNGLPSFLDDSDDESFDQIVCVDKDASEFQENLPSDNESSISLNAKSSVDSIHSIVNVDVIRISDDNDWNNELKSDDEWQ